MTPRKHPPFKCKICNLEKSRTLGRFKRHILLHNSSKLELPNVSLDKHNNMESEQPGNIDKVDPPTRSPISIQTPFKCNFCEKGFNNNFELFIHMYSHSKVTFLTCQVWDKAFNSNVEFKIHIQTHLKKGDTKKNEAGKFQVDRKLVKNSSRLSAPNTNNLREDSCRSTCLICNRSFPNEYQFNQHILTIHKHVKYFVCLFCQKSFKDKKCLEGHTRIHTREKIFICRICNKDFIYRKFLVGHMEKEHSEDKLYKCSYCDFLFSDARRLRKHLSSNHQEIKFNKLENVSSKKVNQEFEDAVKISNYDETESFECNQCDKRFKYSIQLNTHIGKVHKTEQPFLCSYCGSCFTHLTLLAIHKRIHTEVKMLKCTECEKRFSLKASFEQHVEMHAKEKKRLEELKIKEQEKLDNLVEMEKKRNKEVKDEIDEMVKFYQKLLPSYVVRPIYPDNLAFKSTGVE